MLLCVVCNCLLFYCSCTGNCENCCGINGLLRIANIDQDGKVDGNNILNKVFVNGEYKASVNVSRYIGNTEKDYNDAKNEFMDKIDTTGKTTYLIAYVEVKRDDKVVGYFIYYKDANSKQVGYITYGLFQGSAATKIVILSCGSEISNMSCMFYNCESLTELDLSKFNTSKVINMINMFTNCNKLTNIKFPDNLNTNTVTNMRGMFADCSSLSNLDLSNFNTDNVTNMYFMFYNCFQDNATLICQASTIQKITEEAKNSYLTITNENENKDMINNTLNNNQGKVYKCSVEREVKAYAEMARPKIIAVVESDKADLFKLKDIPESGEINGTQIVNKEFVNLVEYVPIVGKKENKQIIDKDSFMASIALTGQTYLSAYVEVGDTARYFIHCTNANSIVKSFSYYGLFQGSEATKIVILRCSNNITNMNSMFYNCSSLTNLDLSALKTDKVTDMSYMFLGCSGLTNIKIPDNIKTSSVVNMRNMFANCSSLTNLDLSNFNTNNVTNMSFMFLGCSKLTNLDLSSFNTKKVRYMSYMFYNCSSLTILDLFNFNTNKVTDMSYMFNNCFTEEHPSTLICKASTILKIISKANSCLIIPNLIIPNDKEDVINNELNEDLDQVCTCSVERGKNEDNPKITYVKEYKLKNMPESGKICDIQIVNENFSEANLVKYVPIDSEEDKQELGKIIESIAITGGKYLYAYVEVEYNGTVKLQYFINCTNANSKIDGNVTYGLFQDSEATKIVILSCGSDIKNIRYMFSGCSSLQELDLSSLNTNTVKDMRGMFADCSSLTILDLSNFNTKKVTDMMWMFRNCSSLKALNISSFNTNNVTNMRFMFYGCSELTNLNLSSFNTDNVTNMSYMFNNCSSLTKLNISSFNTDNVTNMSNMFNECSSLTELDLSNFNTSNVTDMDWMFYNCSSLTELDLSNFNTDNVTDMSYMFAGCSKLLELNLSKFNSNKVTDMRDMFYKCFKNNAKLICKASTIKHVTEDNNDSYLKFVNNYVKNEIENNNNTGQIYTCTVERGENEDNPQITEVA